MNDKIRTKMFYITSVIVIACVIAGSVIASVTAPSKTKYTASAQSGAKVVYVIKSYEGRLAAFRSDVEGVYITTSTAVNSLPYDVQRRLNIGIEFETESEMKRALDEYQS